MDKTPVIFILISVAIVVGLALTAGRTGTTPSPNNSIRCLQNEANLPMHIHPRLQIFVDETAVPLPANIGVSPTCVKVIHTHDQTGADAGQIHVEDDQANSTYTLGDFFAVWGQPFDQGHLLDHVVAANQTLTMTVNGQPNQEFNQLILADNQEIILKLTTKP